MYLSVFDSRCSWIDNFWLVSHIFELRFVPAIIISCQWKNQSSTTRWHYKTIIQRKWRKTRFPFLDTFHWYQLQVFAIIWERWEVVLLVSGLICSESEFACTDGSSCFPLSYRCDSYIDCQLDLSDEVNCDNWGKSFASVWKDSQKTFWGGKFNLFNGLLFLMI